MVRVWRRQGRMIAAVQVGRFVWGLTRTWPFLVRVF